MKFFRRDASQLGFWFAACILCSPLIVGAQTSTASDSDQRVFAAMQTEMDRSMKYLHDGAFGPPYFIAYRLISNLSFDVSASFGSINERRTRDSRTLYVEARYGDPHMDNTNLQYEGFSGIAVGNPQDLRADLWRLTDKAYKNALSGYLSKKALRLTRYDPENLDDFSIARAPIPYENQPQPEYKFQKA